MSLLSRLAVQAARAYGILSARSTNVSADYLVVAGGGGGGVGGARGGGGGGAGGYLTSTTTLSTLTTYTITVGAGGAGGTAGSATPSGGNSSISGTGLTTITATGGGGGGNESGADGQNGGSGGGGAGATNGYVAGTGTSGQGNNGGAGQSLSANNSAAGGGGGAGAAGTASSTGVAGAGGVGLQSSISGTSTYYAGGGGGSVYTGTSASGGSGGGGNGGSATGTAGTANTGGGGGGGATNVSVAGGSGIVIISYTSATPKFVGGTITTSGGKQIHTFTSSGTLSPITPITASYLVVAGGGGGGGATTNQGGGGGGAGGLQASSTTLYSGATYVVTVGAGGTGGVYGGAAAGSGSNSVVSGTGLTTLTSSGGGGGGVGPDTNGSNGGSGGGGGSGGTLRTGGTGTSGQGNNGGQNNGSANYAAGGGGGAGAAGGDGGSVGNGNGGNGSASSISGTSVTYAGGGGAGKHVSASAAGTGGTGGGGNGGSSSVGVSGTTNLGGGGGGGSSGNVGGAGGSGIVIISYAGSQVFNGGLVTSSGGNTIHTFTSSGALTPLTNNLNNSLRFRSSASAYLSRTPTLAGNRQTWTISFWWKRGSISSEQYIVSADTNSSNETWLRINAADTLQFQTLGGTNANLTTSAVFRDPSAWYHIVMAYDSTQATAGNRFKLYVNGNQQTLTGTNPTLNESQAINNTVSQQFCRRASTSSGYADNYLTDVYLIDGQALEPYYFGNNDANGVWKPIQYKGTYGTNGFYLTFGNTTSTTTLGYDSSPNGNNWTCNNISLTAGTTYDAMTDVPTNTSATVANYAVVNPLDKNSSISVAQGNLNISTTTSGANQQIRATIALPDSGKWYWETTNSGSVNNFNAGITQLTASLSVEGAGDLLYNENGIINNNGTTTSGYSTLALNDIMGLAYDADANKLYFYKNNVLVNTGGTTPSATGPFAPMFGMYDSGNAQQINFGQRPFAYTPPTGYVALNTFNLPTPTILQGSNNFGVLTYTGNGATSATRIDTSAVNFTPDFVWIKSRSSTDYNNLYDVNRIVSGDYKRLYSNDTLAEESSTYSGATNLNGFVNGGFTTGAGGNTNTNSATYVAWNWKANGSPVTNTSGSITSTVSVNTTAGFSIVTYTGNGTTGATIGHGLGVVPKMIIFKDRDSVTNWPVYHVSLGNATAVNVNQTNASFASSSFNSTTPTSTLITLGGNGLDVNNTSKKMLAYCWAEIAGFSRFGSYTANASTDGPFIYTGFRPKFILLKNTSRAVNWEIIDSSRNTYNIADAYLLPNLSNAEASANAEGLDFLSNGIKIRGVSTSYNNHTSGDTYIYMAFAENPFKVSNAR